MGTLYENIKALCDEKGIRGGKMCVDLGLSKSLMTDLKAGRKKGISAETAQKIADYFGVSIERVLNGKEKEPAGSGLVNDDAELTAYNVEENKRIRAALEERKRRAWEAYLGGVIELSDYQKELERLTVELERLEPDMPPEDEDAPRRIRESLPPDWKSAYTELDRRHRRAFWAKFIEYMEITPEREVVFLLRDDILH